jgi:serine phosphatase RsbU (regulator of sigma subunit)
MTVITANFVTVGVFLTLPLLTSQANQVFIQGFVSLALLSLPLIIMTLGFIKRQTFTYKPDMTPNHIRRITERVRMSKELEIARQVQMRLLPKISPSVPGFEISGVCIPAKEVGGDYFDFIELGDSRLGIVIGDVSGKGVPAAIYMTLTKGIVQSHADDYISPKDVLVKVNNLLYKTIDKDSFVSLFYAVLDFKKKTLFYSRAGHNPLIHFQKKDGSCDMLEPDGIALGLEKGDLFSKIISEKKIQLQPGDLMVFYTDGFTEAMNRNREEYGEVRLIDIIRKSHDQSIDGIYNAILKDIRQFVKDTPQHDDMTVVLLKGI